MSELTVNVDINDLCPEDISHWRARDVRGGRTDDERIWLELGGRRGRSIAIVLNPVAYDRARQAAGLRKLAAEATALADVLDKAPGDA